MLSKGLRTCLEIYSKSATDWPGASHLIYCRFVWTSGDEHTQEKAKLPHFGKHWMLHNVTQFSWISGQIIVTLNVSLFSNAYIKYMGLTIIYLPQ